MNIGFHNFASSPFAAIDHDYDNNNFDGASIRTALTPRQQRHMHERVAEREREARIREMENEQIQRLNEQRDNIRGRIDALEYKQHTGYTMTTVIIDGEEIQKPVAKTQDEMRETAERIQALRNSVSLTGQQIDQIHRNRAQREELAIEREAMRQQAELEEQLRLQEERMREKAEANRPEPQTEEELEQAIVNETTRGLTMMSVRMDNIRELSRTSARLSAEATQLENEHDTSQTRQELWADIREGRAILQAVRDDSNLAEAQGQFDRASRELADAMKSGDQARYEEARRNFDRYDQQYRNAQAIRSAQGMAAAISENPEPYSLMDGFHGRQLSDLNSRISRLGIAITSEISALYRDSQEMQEEQLRLAQKTPVEDEDEASEYGSIDVML